MRLVTIEAVGPKWRELKLVPSLHTLLCELERGEGRFEPLRRDLPGLRVLYRAGLAARVYGETPTGYLSLPQWQLTQRGHARLREARWAGSEIL